MLFRNIIGQEKVKERLARSIHEARISHAQLFFGEEGSGALPLAMSYAQMLLCTNKQKADSCGQCSSCVKSEKLVHPDIHFVYPIALQKDVRISTHAVAEWRTAVLENPYLNLSDWFVHLSAENKQPVIGVEESAEILRKLQLTTYEGEFKVMIIWLPERMNNTTANKLLKILEEPPDKTLFILVADNHEDIISTILSRAQPVKIPRIDTGSLSHALIEKFGITDSEANEICRLSQGNYLEALNHISTSDEFDYFFDKFTSLMRLSYSRNVAELTKWVSDLAQLSREKQKSFMEYALRMIRGSFMIRNHFDDISLLIRKESEFSQKFSAFITPGNIEGIADEFDKAAYHIERNGNARIILTDLGFRMMVHIRK